MHNLPQGIGFIAASDNYAKAFAEDAILEAFISFIRFKNSTGLRW
jgi:hypothetical protein